MTKSSRSSKELIDRYLEAVRFLLPKEQQDDILAELREDIRSQVEERESELHRSLNQDEVEAILRKYGSPVVAASRYLPPQYLIGPVLFPLYRQILKGVALGYLVPWILVWVGMMSFDPSYRTSHLSAGLISALLSAMRSLWSIAMFAIGTVTLVFAALERAHTRSQFLADWSSRQIVRTQDPNRIPRSDSTVELMIGALVTAWLANGLGSQTVLHLSDVRITLAPAWSTFLWGIFLATLANLVLVTVNLLRPYWTRLRASSRLIINGAGSALFCWFVRASIFSEVAVANVSAERSIEVARTMNMWLARAFPVAVVAAVVLALVDAYRIFRVAKAAPPQLKREASAAVVQIFL